jgi:hypothetical protein
MTAQDAERLRREEDRRIRRAILWVFVLCVCAVIPPLLSMLGGFKPQAEPLGQWFQRSGAVMTIIAVFGQFRAASIAAMIAPGGGWEETLGAFRKYKRLQNVVAVLSLVLAIIGTVIWGYGDLLFPLLHVG